MIRSQPMSESFWLKCSACRREIGFSTRYYECSVSTCNRQRTRLVFCSVPCWDSHLSTVNHRESWAIDKMSPTAAEWAAETAANDSPQQAAAPRRVMAATPAPAPAPASAPTFASAESEVLIVVSKMKKYIRERSGMNCSDGVADALSEHVRAWCDDAIRVAAADGRKTVLDRDVVKRSPVR